ncbi:unnamed protein product [Rotaria sordida]|uniref:Ionotropic glutamate receptor C-terminal domain-containing protein n=1 Tax=Rotaria sordida TaxID=392033 RepID=A0A814NKX5_9BILA|nr:unnamed protein product [Rotaria sordida]
MLSIHSRAMFKAAIILSQTYNITIGEQFIGWQTVQTDANAISALRSTCLAISSSNIVGIVGPVSSREANFIADFAETVSIPVISYAATNPDLSDRNTYRVFYRTVPSDNVAAVAIAQLFTRFNWTSCIIVYQNDGYGIGGTKVLSEAFSKNSVTVVRMIEFDITTFTIQSDLKTPLINSSTRIVILWADSIYTSLILQYALDYNVLGPKFIWILSSNAPLNSFNQSFYQNLIGILTIEPTVGAIVNAPINTTLLNAAYNIWQQYEPESFPGATEVNYYALFAFDATWSLIQSLQQLCSITTNSSSSCISILNSSFCFDYRVLNANSFFDTIINTEFLGVSGPIQFSVNVTDRINGSYYLLQNVQPSSNGVAYVPVLKWSDSSNWTEYALTNLIVWPGNLLISPSGHALLSSISLRIGIIELAPFTTINSIEDENGQITTKYVGYIPDLIDLLQEKMGFIPNLILTPSNQTYDQIIQAVARGVYDMVVGDVTITARRREFVAFSSSIFDNSLRLILRKQRPVRVDLVSYLKPFSLKLWMVILVSLIYAAFLIYLIERQDNKSLQDRSIISSFAMSLWYSIGNLMGYGGDMQPSTAAGRLLTVGLYVLSLVLAATYTANLASNLTLTKSKNIISGIDDIKNGMISPSRIGISLGTASEDYYLQVISKGSRDFHELKSQQDLYNDLLNDVIDTSFMDIGVAEYITNNVYCNLTLVGADFDKSAFGIVIPKNWLYEQDLDVNILALRESGKLDELTLKWFQTNNCPDSSGALATDSMGIEAMSGLFVTYAVITILSLLLFAWTKRFLIKDIILKLMRRKALLVEPNVSETRHSSKTFKASQVSQRSSFNIVHF